MDRTIGLGVALLLSSYALTACERTPLTWSSAATGGATLSFGTGGTDVRGSGGDATREDGSGRGGSGGSVVTGGVPATGGSPGRGGSGGVPATGGSPGRGGSGGRGGTGGGSGGFGSISSGGSGGASCSNGLPCGGNLIGTWSVTSSCLRVRGDLDLTLLGFACTSAQVSGSLQVTGTWIAKANGTYVDNTTTSGTETIVLPASCLVVSGTTVTCEGMASVLRSTWGLESLRCAPASVGGCSCTATVKQAGGIGVLAMDPQITGDFKTSGNTVTLSGVTEDTTYSYCVSGNAMTWSPQGTSTTTTGTIMFQKGG